MNNYKNLNNSIRNFKNNNIIKYSFLNLANKINIKLE
jgi:hypothetical protein